MSIVNMSGRRRLRMYSNECGQTLSPCDWAAGGYIFGRREATR